MDENREGDVNPTQSLPTEVEGFCTPPPSEQQLAQHAGTQKSCEQIAVPHASLEQASSHGQLRSASHTAAQVGDTLDPQPLWQLEAIQGARTASNCLMQLATADEKLENARASNRRAQKRYRERGVKYQEAQKRWTSLAALLQL